MKCFNIIFDLWLYPDEVFTQLWTAFSECQRDEGMIAEFDVRVRKAGVSKIHQVTGGSDLKL
jgi:hypothetical protein